MTFLDILTRLCWITVILSIGTIVMEVWFNHYYRGE